MKIKEWMCGTKITYKHKSHTLAWMYLCSIMLAAVVFSLHTLLTLKSYEAIDKSYIFCVFYFILCSYFLWYCYTIFKCNHYDITLKEDGFSHKVLITKEVKYSQILEMLMITMTSRDGTVYKIIRIKSKKHGIIRMRVNDLSDQDEDYILYNLQRKTKKYIKDKVKKSFFV